VGEERPHLYIVPPPEEEEKSLTLEAPEGKVLHRRYTVVVEPDGTEYVEDIEEWLTD